MYQLTAATKKLLQLKNRIRGASGGTSAGKTIGWLQILIDDAQTDTRPTLTSVVSETLPHLKKGAMRDFLDIMKVHGYYQESRWNRTNLTYEFETGSQVEFFSADQPDRVRGPRRDRLFINEANNIHKEVFTNLEVRTKEYILLDWNPTHEFWFYTDIKDNPNFEVDFLTLTYKDNEALDPRIVKAIESRKDNSNWWRVYGLGQMGIIEGRIYDNWIALSRIPKEARLVRYGLDFGFSSDPAAVVAVYEYQHGFILDEIVYEIGMHNRPLAERIKKLPAAKIVADSVEPKSIDEMRSYGLDIIPSVKGPGSVNYGIQLLQDQKIYYTKRSLNLVREQRQYLWKTDKDGRALGIPAPGSDHLLDATRYAISTLVAQPVIEYAGADDI